MSNKFNGYTRLGNKTETVKQLVLDGMSEDHVKNGGRIETNGAEMMQQICKLHPRVMQHVLLEVD